MLLGFPASTVKTLCVMIFVDSDKCQNCNDGDARFFYPYSSPVLYADKRVEVQLHTLSLGVGVARRRKK